MQTIVVSGGAGYIGSVLCRLLLAKGYRVRVIDNLRFSGEAILDLVSHPNFEFLKGDICNRSDLELAVKNADAVMHLAAIVGDPACSAEPELARRTNIDASKLFYEISNLNKVPRFIFASTCSNYGKMKDSNSYVTEDSELSPISLYAESKVSFEKFLLNQSRQNICKPTVLRFSTVYGVSQRIRLDLTVNEFTKELALGRELVIFGEQFWRPYCHVTDLARSMLAGLTAPSHKVEFNVFNVGDTSENYTKQMIVEKIKDFIPEIKIKYVQKNDDPRDYRVSFEKIKKELDFCITKRVPDGIMEILKVVQSGFISDVDHSKYRNT